MYTRSIDLSYHKGIYLPACSRLAFELPLYYCDAYYRGQEKLPDQTFWICEPETESILGCVGFHFKGQVACSQLFAPFGSYCGQDLSRPVLQEFITFIEQNLARTGISRIQYRHPSGIYQSARWVKTLKDHGYRVSSVSSHHITVDHQDYFEKLHQMERRKLKKSGEFSFKWIPGLQFEKVFQFISDCRACRNRALSLDLPAFRKIMNQIPRGFLFPSVLHDKVIIAASILVKVNSNIWYNFYPAHSPRYHGQSPMVFLLSALYREARQYGIDHIDLGNSQVDGQIKPSLALFKHRMGGKVTNQYFCEKTL